MKTINKNESLLLQSLATTSLLAELSNAKFLESDYFNNLTFANESHKNILKISGLGNPATMQMMLYALLIIPREILSKENYIELESYAKRINPLVFDYAEEGTSSTYKGENNIKDINFFRHIRNAVAHSRCDYSRENNKNFVIFTDSDKRTNKQCSIKMECCNVGYILMELQRLTGEYYNNAHKESKSNTSP